MKVNNGGEEFDCCECGLFAHMGMLCCHAIKVMFSIFVAAWQKSFNIAD